MTGATGQGWVVGGWWFMVASGGEHSPDAVRLYRERLNGLMRACVAVSDVQSLQETVQQILREARKVTRADAGSIYLREGQTLTFLSSQNDTLWPNTDVAASSALASVKIHVGCQSIAGYVAQSGRIINLPDCYAISADAPYQFNRSGDGATGYRSRTLLAMPLRDPQGDITGVLQLLNRLPDGDDGDCFSSADEEVLASFCSIAAVAIRNAQLVEELQRAHHETIARLAMAAESRDEDTGRHVQRMSLYCHLLGQAAGFDRRQAHTLRNGATMHDIGKLAIPDRILKKPSGLSAEERAEMQRHTVYGAAILQDSGNPTLEMGRTICLTHHERWDGNGYPHGLKGDAIPLEGRIAAVADVFDALCSRRCYHEARPFEDVLNLLQDEAGRAFDPQLVTLFVREREAVKDVYQRHPDRARPPKDNGELLMSALIENR